MGYTAIALGMAALTFHAVSHMVFGALGTTPQDPAWGFVMALYISLAIAGLAALPKRGLPSPVRKLTILPNLTTGALLGFYYGGRAAAEDPQLAIIAASLTGLTTGLICSARPQANWFASLITSVGAIAAYGLAFAAVGMASAGLSTGHILAGLGWAALTLAYFALALKGLEDSRKLLIQAASTQFQKTDLSQSRFEGVYPDPHFLS